MSTVLRDAIQEYVQEAHEQALRCASRATLSVAYVSDGNSLVPTGSLANAIVCLAQQEVWERVEAVLNSMVARAVVTNDQCDTDIQRVTQVASLIVAAWRGDADRLAHDSAATIDAISLEADDEAEYYGEVSGMIITAARLGEAAKTMRKAAGELEAHIKNGFRAI